MDKILFFNILMVGKHILNAGILLTMAYLWSFNSNNVDRAIKVLLAIGGFSELVFLALLLFGKLTIGG